ncbi:ATP-binding cassette domain-containing protein [Glycomyces scopariae]
MGPAYAPAAAPGRALSSRERATFGDCAGAVRRSYGGGVIEVNHLTKRYRGGTAVDDLTFTVEPGRVTGFLGPNGAGKSTTIRMVLGLDRPTAGSALIGGRSYAELKRPLTAVGALLEASDLHPGRSARDHLRWLAASNGLGRKRVQEVLEETGLSEAAGKRVRAFSLGMRQRLGIAAALLGDPGVLILDEPVNGLDPEGVIWVRNLAKRLAGEGRTVLVSSHLMAEMALTASHLVVIGRGRLLADLPTEEFVSAHSGANLEEAFMRLTSESVQYRAGGAR